METPTTGSVLGIDVGWSTVRRSSAVCRLDWNATEVSWTIERFTAQHDDRTSTVGRVIAGHRLLAAAFDGPLDGNLDREIKAYRGAEQLLTNRLIRERIGKLAQSNSGNGIMLNAHANECAKIVLQHDLVRAGHSSEVRIHDHAIVEAFPNSFLGMMLEEPAALKGLGGRRSDRYFVALADCGKLLAVLKSMLPGRSLRQKFDEVTDHDERAALVCALTALCVAAGRFSAAGGSDGWIILPPRGEMAKWARDVLEAGQITHDKARFFFA